MKLMSTSGRVVRGRALSDATGSRKNAFGLHQADDNALNTDEVLFSRMNAPLRYAEKDIYWANDGLPGGGHDVLPDSDMLTAVHVYTSHFYEALAQRHDKNGRGNIRPVNQRSMDETALLAVGILLEEAARESLGKNGDLVFTEGVDDATYGRAGRRGEQEAASSHGLQVRVGFGSDDASRKGTHSKRRKTDHERD